jgi:hypothetical protein
MAGPNEKKICGSAQVFSAQFDEEGVFVYQAFNEKIADWAIAHQSLGGPDFNTARMTWIKPSFAWVLYRSSYGTKHNQTRILKIKIEHTALASLLNKCHCKEGGGGSKGRIQWDPARDIMESEGRVPRKKMRERAIQIGLKGSLSEEYVQNVIAISDVTNLSSRIRAAHQSKDQAAAMDALGSCLPLEESYTPRCSLEVLERLGMAPGETASMVASLGRGKSRA